MTIEVDRTATILILLRLQSIRTIELIRATGTCRLLRMVLLLMTDTMAAVAERLLLTTMVVGMIVLLLLTIGKH